MLWHQYGGLLIIGWIVFIIFYNNWLIAKCGVSAMRLGRILAAALDFFLWMLVFSAEGFTFGLLVLIALAAFVLLMILALNYTDCQSVLHAILMTLFQLTGGFLVFWMICSLTGSRKKKR